MKTLCILVLVSVLQAVNGVAIGPRHPSGVVQAPIWRRDLTRSVENDLRRREHLSKRQTSNTASLMLSNPPGNLLYLANGTELLKRGALI